MLADTPSLFDPYLLFQDAPCGLVVTQEDGTIVRANATFSEWVGFSEQELCSRRFQDLLSMGGRIFHQTHWAPLMQMQGSVAEVKLELMHRDRHCVTMLLNGVRRERGGAVFNELALFGTTDRDRYERELVKARKMAETLLQENAEAQRALQQAQAELHRAYETAQRRALLAEQMVAIVSHDLKNPLTAIKMASGFLAKGERTAKESTMIGHISQSADRAERMIADLLDLARSRAGQGIAIAPSAVDLHALIGRSVEELRVIFPKATLLHHSIGAGSAHVDADRIQQVVGNLTANSVAYGDSQRPISITSQVEGQEVVISVHNQGAAIPQALMAVLFEPMTRGLDGPSDIRSVGLGLFIVREIAKAHGGNVSVNSNAQNGTRFDVRVPRAYRPGA